jgi:hypothetical protein
MCVGWCRLLLRSMHAAGAVERAMCYVWCTVLCGAIARVGATMQFSW